LKIKTFLWTSENAVRNQVWIAMIYYLIMYFIAYQANISKKWMLKLTRLLWEFCMSRRSIIELLRVENKEKFEKCRDWPVQNRLFFI
jgi:small-conductance mechanosensitive channel